MSVQERNMEQEREAFSGILEAEEREREKSDGGGVPNVRLDGELLQSHLSTRGGLTSGERHSVKVPHQKPAAA